MARRPGVRRPRGRLPDRRPHGARRAGRAGRPGSRRGAGPDGRLPSPPRPDRVGHPRRGRAAAGLPRFRPGLVAGEGQARADRPEALADQDPDQARAMAAEISERPGTRLAGVMAYEAQIAGVGDRIRGRPLRSAAIRWMQAASEREIRRRLPQLVAAVSRAGRARVRERRRDRQRGAHRRRRNGDRGDRRVRLLRALPVRRLPLPGPDSRGLLRDSGGPPAEPDLRHGARRRIPGIGRGRRRPAAQAVPAGGPPPRPAGGRGRGADPLSGASARDAFESATGSTCAMPRRGSYASASARCYLVEGDRIADQVPTYRGEGKAFL